MFRLRSVRAKLITLASLSIVVTVVMLIVLGMMMQQQLTDEAGSRVRRAKRTYVADLNDRIATLKLASALLANNPEIQRAIRDKDAVAAQALSDSFAELYTNSDVVLVAKDKSIVAAVGCDSEDVANRKIVQNALDGKAAEGLSGRGCSPTAVAGTTPAAKVPAYLVAQPTPDGAVVIGFRFTKERIESTADAAGIELAMIDAQGVMIHHTADFPDGGVAVTEGRKLINLGDKVFVVERFTDDRLVTGRGNAYQLVAARDVTRLRTRLHKQLGIAFFVVLAAGAVALVWGVRLANAMSEALLRVSGALGRLKQQEYVKVAEIKTGDELEDLATGFNTMVDGLQERDKLKTTFGKYMTEAVVEHLMAGKVQLGGESITATILFSDIRSFTSISEKMDAKDLVAILNEYFTDMVDVVIHEDGVVDKYIGDAIMAVFGAPVPRADSAVRAVRAAVGMRAALETFNQRLISRGIKPIETGIGIHTGVVVAGNIGSEKRMEYTVIGDTVNLASRLESATKELGVAVLISEDTYALVKDEFELRPVKEITVKGRETPVVTYEVLSSKSPVYTPPSPRPKTLV